MPNNIENLICNCNKCKSDFRLNSYCLKTLKNISVEDSNGRFERLQLTILTCPICNSERVVQIDNDESLYILNKQFTLNTVIGKRKCNFKDTEKQEKKLKYYSALLIQIRKDLNLKYNGSVYYFQNKNKKISINVPDVKILDYSLEE